MRGEGRLTPYSEVDENLGNLLREYRPKRSRYVTEFPFWRLRNDGIWEIPGAESIGETSRRDAKKGDLVRYNVSGGLTEDIARQLGKDSVLALEIVQNMLDAHSPSSNHEDILQAVGIEPTLKSRGRQQRNPNFQTNILRAYEYRGAVCGFDVRLGLNPVALEAAHIKWHQVRGPDGEVNWLALCSLHQKLFDRGSCTLSDHLEILVLWRRPRYPRAPTARYSVFLLGRPTIPARATLAGTSEKSSKASSANADPAPNSGQSCQNLYADSDGIPDKRT